MLGVRNKTITVHQSQILNKVSIEPINQVIQRHERYNESLGATMECPEENDEPKSEN